MSLFSPAFFNNTQAAFQSRNKSDLNNAFFLFRIMNNPVFVKTGTALAIVALKLRLPITPIIKKTIYRQFCGGEQAKDCINIVNKLFQYNVKTILDYSIEGKDHERDFDNTAKEIINTILLAQHNPGIPIVSMKITGIGRFSLLEKKQGKESLSEKEEQEFDRIRRRLKAICTEAQKANVSVYIDAEESWIQEPIDDLADEMMSLYNLTNPIVFNTVQLYLTGRLSFLKMSLEKAKESNYILAVKLVRGAYMEKERERAEKMNYTSPVQKDKQASDKDYNTSLEFCINNINKVAFCAATHNEQSCLKLMELMHQKNIKKEHPFIYFSQLYGMGDHISFNLAQAGYNVAKYLPYGPVKDVVPYLIRRAQENTSIAGQMSRELTLVKKEIERRKKASS